MLGIVNIKSWFFFWVLLYPVFIYFFGTKLNYFYFPTLSVALIIVLWISKSRLHALKSNVGLYILLIALMVCSSLGIMSIRYSFPAFFFLVATIFLLGSDNLGNTITQAPMIILSLLYLTLNVFMILEGNFEDGRFSGFAESASTYTVFITAQVIIALLHLKNRLIAWIVYFASIFFIFQSQTRINLVFVLAIPIIIFFVTRKKTRFIFFMLFSTALYFLYPIYLYLKQRTDLVHYRYQDGHDPSFITRYFFQKQMTDLFAKASPMQMIFGRGTEYSRLYILQMDGVDYLPHNDFLRIINDFGILGFVLIITFLTLLAARNITTCCLCALYLISFYHNMIFNLLVLSLALIFVNVNKTEIQVSRTSRIRIDK